MLQHKDVEFHWCITILPVPKLLNMFHMYETVVKRGVNSGFENDA